MTIRGTATTKRTQQANDRLKKKFFFNVAFRGGIVSERFFSDRNASCRSKSDGPSSRAVIYVRNVRVVSTRLRTKKSYKNTIREGGASYSDARLRHIRHVTPFDIQHIRLTAYFRILVAVVLAVGLVVALPVERYAMPVLALEFVF